MSELKSTAEVMRKLALLALLFGLAASAKDNLTTIQDLKKIAQAGLILESPVTLHGIATSPSGWKDSFFLQDATGGISVNRTDNTVVVSGDRVTVEGTLEAGKFAPLILSSRVTVTGRAALPVPARPTFEDLSSGTFDSRWIAVKGVVHSAQITDSWGRQILLLNLNIPGGMISVHILKFAGMAVDGLVDSAVTVTGACGTKFNDRKQLTGTRLFVPGPEYLKIDSPAPDPARIPRSRMEQLQRYSLSNGLRHRLNLSGTLTYQSREHGLYLEENGSAVHVETAQREIFRLGDRLEVLGFTHTFGFSPGLKDAQVRWLGQGEEPRPLRVNASDVIRIVDGFRSSAYDGRLIQMTATVVEQSPGSREQLWLMRQGDTLFQAQLEGKQVPGGGNFETQSTVLVTGVCVVETDDGGEPASFHLLMRSARDVSIAHSPYWKQSIFVLTASLLCLVTVGILLWGFQNRYAREVSKRFGMEARVTKLARFRYASLALSWAVFCAAFLSLAAARIHHTDYQDLAGPWVAQVGLLPLAAAIGFSQSSSSRSWKRKVSLACSALAAAGGLLALYEYQARAGSGQDRMADLFRGGGMTVTVAFCFCLLGLNPFLPGRRLILLAQSLIIAVGTISLLNLVSRLYTATNEHGIARHIAMPMPLAGALFLLSLAALLSQPESGFVRSITSPYLGGLVSRRLLPAALLPILIGWLRLQGQLYGLYDTFFGLALFALCNVVCFGCVVWVSAAVLNRLDTARSQTEQELRERDQRLELLFEKSGIGDFTWDVARGEVRAHRIVWQLYGAENDLERAPADWFTKRQHPDDAAMIAEKVQAALEDRTPLDLEFRLVLPDGGIRWLSCRGEVVRDSSGNPTHTNGLNIDITERKRSEMLLLESMEAARAADRGEFLAGLEFSKIAVWRWMLAGNRLTWTGPVEEVFGKKSEQLSEFGQFEAIVHAEDLELVRDNTGASISSGREYRAQFRILVDEKVRWISSRGGVIRDEAGIICGMSGVSYDITNTKQAEELLRQSWQSFRDLADAMPQIVWIANASGMIQYRNQQWHAYTGSSDGQQFSDFIHPDDVTHSAQMLQQSMQGATEFVCEQRLKRASDNSYRWHLSRALPILDTQGKIWRWYGTSTDIDDYKRVQAEIELLNQGLELRVEERSVELAEIELRYQQLVDGVKDYAIFMLDESGHVKSWNAGAEQLTGYASKEIIGHHFSKFYSQAAIEYSEHERTLAQTMTLGHHSEEGWRIRKHGRAFWASAVTTLLFDGKGGLKGFSQIIRDMTSQREAMSLLIAERQTAELANQAKSNFLASMSHEIRTPMNAILGMADLLSETELDEIQREYVGRFQRAGSNLMAIINDLLDLSKIESGHFELEEVPFDLEEVTQRAVDLVAPKAHRKQVNLACRMVPGLGASQAPGWGASLVGDPNRLQQILLNLLGNAVKFTERGEIVLTVRPHEDGDPRHVQFEVSDTGIGIARDKLASIFEDFMQAESSTTRRFGGTGLGLGIARRLVQRMGGVIRVKSEPGEGSTFAFDAIFRGGEGLPPGSQQPRILEDLSLKRILIVDSSLTNQVIYREMCASWSMRPEVTASAREAVSLLKQGIRQSDPFSMVMLDRFSSDLDAFAALDQIKAACPGLPVIMTTAEDQPGEATRATASGFAGYVVKPIRRSNLLRLISSLLMQASTGQGTGHPANGDGHFRKDAANDLRWKVLVADDSDDNRFLIEAYLMGSCYEPAFAGDGRIAVDSFSSETFDLVLMDIQMPVLDGLQATAAIRALEDKVGRRPVPIIALTGNAMAEDVAKSTAVGCDAHLAKPISKKELLRILDKWKATVEQK